MTTIVDSNVLLDVFLGDPRWAKRSAAALEDAIEEGDIAINAVIFAEVTPIFSTKEDLEAELAALGAAELAITRDVAFLAGRAYREYRRNGGPRSSLLADFFIGAQAAMESCAILTRDARRYGAYFPTVQIIEP